MNFVVDTFLVKIFVFINNKWINVHQVSMNIFIGYMHENVYLHMNVSFDLLFPENSNLIL